MAWLNIDDNAPHHRKMLAAGDVACWLWICGLAYCQRQVTDGVIPAEALPFLGCVGWKAAALRLVSAGLWAADGSGYRVHDFLEWNDSAEARRDKKAKSDARVARFRAARKRGGNAITEPSLERIGNTTPQPQPQPQPQERDFVAARAPVGGLITPPKNWGLNHGAHTAGFCDWMCLMADDFGRFAARLDGAEKALKWAESVRASGVIPTGKPWEFWNRQFDAAHGSDAPAAGGFSKADWDAHAPGGAIDKKLGLV